MCCCCPHQVYTWFLATYKASVAVGMSGYFLLVLDMFGVGLLLAKFVEPGVLLLSGQGSVCVCVCRFGGGGPLLCCG